jgi:hypothetical protein
VTSFANAQKIVNFPAFKSTNRSSLKIEQIELRNDATILRMKISYDPNKFWSINKESYLLVDGNPEKILVTKAEGIGLGERMYTKNGTSLFSLYFPPVDTAARTLDFIEGDCNACYRIKGVDLSEKNIVQMYADTTYLAVKASDDDVASKSSTIISNNDQYVSQNSSATYDGSPYNIMFAWKKKTKAKNPHWNGMGIALANFDGMNNVNADLAISTSYSFIINPIDYCVPISSHWLLVSGMGLDFSRYHFKGNVGLTVVDGITKFVRSADESYKSSKLITYYITVPLLLEYQTKLSNRTFYISGGVVGYIKYYSKSQIDVKVEGGIEARNLGRDLNILPVNGRLMFQTGISDISFYAYYSPFSLFEKGKGPDLKPIGVGIVLDF